jgi:cytochrome b561
MTHWHPLSKALHWTMAAMLAGMVGLGLLMVRAAEEAVRTGDSTAGVAGLPVFEAYQWHKSVGVALFGLAALRLAWRFLRPGPPLPATVSPVARHATATAHALLYALMFALPLSGWLLASASPLGVPTVVFGLVTLPDPLPGDALLEARLAWLHFAGVLALVGIVTVHAGAALKHHFVDRDGVLRAMLPRIGARPDPKARP